LETLLSGAVMMYRLTSWQLSAMMTRVGRQAFFPINDSQNSRRM